MPSCKCNAKRPRYASNLTRSVREGNKMGDHAENAHQLCVEYKCAVRRFVTGNMLEKGDF